LILFSLIVGSFSAGLGWEYPSDMWSVGCILAELFTGREKEGEIAPVDCLMSFFFAILV
jgi:hypothetical protein